MIKLIKEVYMKHNKKIDLTLLDPRASIRHDYRPFFETARQLNPYSVCVPSAMVEEAYVALTDTDIKVCSVVGFPFGNASPHAMGEEANEAQDRGADEIDMVIEHGLVKDGAYSMITEDINYVKSFMFDDDILKVIIETDYLTPDQVIKVTEAVIKSKADFIKTSTGYALIKDDPAVKYNKVILMSNTISKHSSDLKIKVSGGVKTERDIEKYLLIEHVDRIGTSTVDY